MHWISHVSIMRRSHPLQTKMFEVTTPAPDALLCQSPEVADGASAHVRGNGIHEVCDGILQLWNILGALFIDFGLHIAPEKEI